jgi:hypothetical protein
LYTGDLNDTAPLVEIINSGCTIDKMYVDSHNDRKPNLHHISIHQVNDIITPELRSRIYCMHLPVDPKCIAEAQAYGFNVVTVSA